MGFALAARLPYFTRSDFPLNDGGLFVAMSRDLLAGHFALPASTSYNAEHIPFAYPPLAFYIVAGTTALTGVDPLVLARWLPLVANLATVVCVAQLARSILRPGWAATLAAVVFALLPRSYEWVIMGGGLTRSIGYLAAVACVSQAVHLARSPGRWRVGLCSVVAGLALASHLEEGLFALYSLALVLLCFGGGMRSVLTSAIVGVGAALLTAPWWATVIAYHGLAPFQAASLTSGWTTPGTLLAAVGEFLAPRSLPLSVIGSLGVLGAGLCLVRREPFLPVWLLAIFVLTPRSAPTQAVLPLALLTSLAAAELVVPRLARDVQRAGGAMGGFRGPVVAQIGQLLGMDNGRLVASTLMLLMVLGGVYRIWPRLPLEPFTLDSLSPGERDGMALLANRTGPNDPVLVLSTTESWEEDMAGEWFPVLANRQSVLTPQGAEWLPDNLHARKVCLFQKVREVAPWGISDLDTWASERGVVFSAVYISKVPRGPIDWEPVVRSARTSPDYTVLLDTPAAAVLRRASPITPRWKESGEFVVASDCASLADQPMATVAIFDGVFGSRAAQAWVQQHESAGPTRPTLTRRFGQIGSTLPRFGI